MNPLIGSPLPAPQRRGHAPRPCPTRLRRARRAGQNARSHCCWEGGAEFEGSWKARETLFPVAMPYGFSPAGGTGSAPLPGPAFFSCQYSSSTQLFCSDLSRTFPLLSEGILLPHPRLPRGLQPSQAPLRRFRALSRSSRFLRWVPLCSPSFAGARGLRAAPLLKALARLGSRRTTFPSGSSGRRRACGQVTRSPDPR